MTMYMYGREPLWPSPESEPVARAKISTKFFAKVAHLTIYFNDFSWDYNGFLISTES